MNIQPHRINEISSLAHSLWIDFAELTGKSASSLFARASHSQRPNPVILGFFRFCAEIFASDSADTDVEANVMFFNLERMSQDSTGRAASWLMWMTDSNRAECPTILIDNACLDESLSILDAIRARNHLTLHEIGHLVLHKDQLKSDESRTHQPKFAKQALPHHESEAWWFCYSLLGLCVAQCAYENRQIPSNADDQIWKIWLR